MISLVLVSHSAKIAEGARDLALQMTQDKVQIAVAGGLNDPEHPIGTDPMKVMEAINTVYSDDGVIILMDLGSALMSAETAIEFLEPDQQSKIHLCPAPLIEGTVAAAVQASVGGSIELVLQEASAALDSKRSHITGTAVAEHPTTASPDSRSQDGQRTLTITVPNAQGIHARPAARIVSIANQFNAALTIQKAAQSVNAKSINQVTLLNAQQGDQLTFIAGGDTASDALSAIQALAHDNFGDDDSIQHTANGTVPLEQTQAADGLLQGVAASIGLAIGTVYRLDEQLPQISPDPSQGTQAEQAQLSSAIEDAIGDLQRLIKDTKQTIGAKQAEIFDAHILLLRDDALREPAFKHIEAQKNAATAWWEAIEALAAQYRDSGNNYLQARANDIFDVGKRVLRKLMPEAQANGAVPPDSIIVASDLTPSDTAQLDPKHVQAIVTEFGGATSHTAIIARSLGIPAVVGIGAGLASLVEGQTVIVDGAAGQVHPQPSSDKLHETQQTIEARQQQQRDLIAQSQQPAITSDSRPIEIVANIGKASDARHLLEQGAEGVGLFRSELLFMDRPQAPTEAEQADAYNDTAQQLKDYPLIIRTLDVGGDKAIDYIHIDAEDNPFLGYRGVRYWLGNQALAKTQLRAICRTSADHNVKLMFPMIGTLDELHAAKALLSEVRAELDAEGHRYDSAMEVGMMIEVPSAVLLADQFAQHVDFFSIGTNDLTQYLMAADRGNAQVSNLVDPFQPAVLRAIKQVVDAAHAAEKWVGMCGEMAGNPLATGLLVGLGLDELSMSAPAIPAVKDCIRKLSYADARTQAQEALTMESAEQVKAYLQGEQTP